MIEWSQYPRLNSLFEDSEIDNPANYFSKAIQREVLKRPLPKQCYSELESELEMLDERAWSQFCHKAKQYISVTDKLRKYQQLFDFFNEAKGYIYLRSQGYNDIEFIEENDNARTPDLIAHKQCDVILLEVKTINQSDEYLKYVRTPFSDREKKSGKVPHGVSEPLKVKISETVNNAVDQLVSYKSDDLNICKMIAYICICPDYFPLLDTNDFVALQEYCQSLASGNVDVVPSIICT